MKSKYQERKKVVLAAQILDELETRWQYDSESHSRCRVEER